MLLAICKENPLSQPIEIGSYRGFQMEVFYDTFNTCYCLNICGMRKYKVELGADAIGNLTRIENEIAKLPARLETAKTRKEETIAQLETAKEEVQAKIEGLYEKYPKVLGVFDTETAEELTEEECAALIKVVELKNKLTDMEMQSVYFRGCYDSVGYLKKAGIL